MIGLPRSGTSLVQKLIHEQTGRSSPKFRDFGIDLSRVPKRVLELNKTILDDRSLAEDNDFPGYQFQGDFHGYREWLSRRGDFWVLKSPDHIGQLGFLVHTFPEARFLWCVRDGSSTMTSVQEYFYTTGLRWPYDPVKGLKDSLYLVKTMPERFDWIYVKDIPEWESNRPPSPYDSQVSRDVDYLQGQLKGVARYVTSRDFKKYYSREAQGDPSA